MIKAPVLLIGFNRPDTMQHVFDAVKLSKPAVLYYAVDGPRTGRNEEGKVQEVRNIINQVDWPCKVNTLFRDENVGCGRGPAEAITWAFTNEDRLIVLEDDCVPSQSFFTFCDDMLELYKEDERVNIVSGRSHWHGSHFFNDYDYIFSHYAHTWGWATWKRVWNEYDIRMSDLPYYIKQGGSRNLLCNEVIGKKCDKGLLHIYSNIEDEISHSWDSQFFYTRLKTAGLGIVPSRNLIHNIGCDGTHTSTVDKLTVEDMPLVLRHPLLVLPNREYELYHYHNHISKKVSIVKRIMHVIKHMLCKE